MANGDAKREFRSVYVADHPRMLTPVGGPSLTRQEFADECDINQIMARYEKTGGLDMFGVKLAEPRYLDLTGLPDYQGAMNIMIAAQEAFMTLPATIRRDFDNDPGKFVAFAEDPENRAVLQEWGLAEPDKPAPVPMRVEVVNPLEPAPIAPASSPKA